MNAATPPIPESNPAPAAPISAPAIEVLATEVEVIAKDAPAGAPPAKKAEIETVEIAAKVVSAERRAQFYHTLKSTTHVRGIVHTPGMRISQVTAGIDTYPVPEGKTWDEIYPDGIDVVVDSNAGGGVWLTTVLANDTKADVRASVAYVLESSDVTESTSSGETSAQVASSTPSARQSRTGAPRPGGRRVMAPSQPDLRRGERPAGPRPRVRTGPQDGRDTPSGVRVGGPAPRRAANAASPGIISQQAPSRKRAQGRGPASTTEEDSEVEAVLTESGELTIRVESWRFPALRDLVCKGAPIPPDHIGALQNAIRRRGDSAGKPIVLSEALAERLTHVLTRGGRLTEEERAELGRAIDPPPALEAPETAGGAT